MVADMLCDVMTDQIASPNRSSMRASQCDGKVVFKRIGFARAAANRKDRRVVYRCQFCFHWHVGTPEPKAKKFTKRDKFIRLFLQPEWVDEQ